MKAVFSLLSRAETTKVSADTPKTQTPNISKSTDVTLQGNEQATPPSVYGCDIFLFDVASMVDENAPPPPPPPPSSEDSLGLSSRSTKSIRSNLTKEHKGTRNPLLYYEIVQALGKGSMGWVAKVKKRDHIVGGTSRQEIVEYFAREHSGVEENAMPWQENDANSDSDEKKDGKVTIKQQESKALRRGISSSYEMLFALKSIRYDCVADPTLLDELRNEVDILRTLDHPYIVKAVETFELPGQIFMVLELCNGGDLYTRDPYTEEESARILSSIISAVSYMHRHNIIHRDLKYENILFSTNDPLSDVKLIDFGLSKRYAKANDIMTQTVGTIYTMAPEVLRGRYTSQADMWSIGVIAYMLLSSLMPFYGESRNDVIKAILKGQYTFNGRRWKKVSEQAKSFVADLLVLDYDECPTAEEAFSSPWLNRRHKASVRNPHAEELGRIHASIKSFTEYSKLKKLALMIIAHRSTSEEIGILRKVFQQFDTSKSGVISFPEFKHALAQYAYADEELVRMFNGLAFDGSGVIKYTEFIASCIESLRPINEERIAEAFDRLDCDDSGLISSENLEELLGDQISSTEIEEIIREASGGEESITYEKFLALWDTKEIDLSTTSYSTGESMSLDSDEREKMRQENDDETTVARENFLEEKMESERKFDDALNSNIIDIGGAEKLTARLFEDLSWRGLGDVPEE